MWSAGENRNNRSEEINDSRNEEISKLSVIEVFSIEESEEKSGNM